MRCSHCGTELPEGSRYCNVCGEPVVDWQRLSNRRAKAAEIRDKTKYALIGFFALFFTCGILFMLCTESVVTGLIVGLVAGSIAAGAIGLIFALQPKRRDVIDAQFYRDKTSICPICGCHNVSVYRKGYDWNDAFWGTMFKLRGSRYVAGMNSNETMCVCNHCHYRWRTGYDYRLIDKK